MAIRHDAVKAGNDHAAILCDAAKRFVRMFPVNLAIEGKLEPLGSIEEIEAEVFRHEAGSKILPAGDQFILADALLHFLVEGRKLLIDIRGEAAIGRNGAVALRHHAEDAFGTDAVLQMCVAEIEKIGNFVVGRKALAGCGNNHNPAGRIRRDNLADFFELGRIGQGGTAEFNYF